MGIMQHKVEKFLQPEHSVAHFPAVFLSFAGYIVCAVSTFYTGIGKTFKADARFTRGMQHFHVIKRSFPQVDGHELSLA